MIKKILYTFYVLFFRNTPEDYRPYALFFPFIRRILVKIYLKKCGIGLRVKSGAEISPNCEIWDYSELGTRCLIQANTKIGSNVIMGPDVKIYTRNHIFTNKDIPIKNQGKEIKQSF